MAHYTRANKRFTRWLTTEHNERYRPRIEAGRRLRDLIAELEAPEIGATERTESWTRNRVRDVRKARRMRQETAQIGIERCRSAEPPLPPEFQLPSLMCADEVVARRRLTVANDFPS